MTLKSIIPAVPFVIPAVPFVIPAVPFVIPVVPFVIPAKAGIQVKWQQSPSRNRKN
jgi:hypothetical protein